MSGHDVDADALQWLSVDELAARRRQLVRELNRVTPHEPIDAGAQARILAQAEAIDRVQRDRRRD